MIIWDEATNIDDAAWRALLRYVNKDDPMKPNIVRNSLAQFMRTRIRPVHISKPIHTIMVPAIPAPGATLVQKTILGTGVTYRCPEGPRSWRGKSARRIALRMRRELRGTA